MVDLTVLNDSDNTPSWVRRARESYQERLNRKDSRSMQVEAEAQRTIADAEQQLGRALSTDEQLEIYNALNEGRDFNLQGERVAAPTADFSNVTSTPADTVPDSPTYWEQRADEMRQSVGEIESFVSDVAVPGLQRTAARLIDQAARFTEAGLSSSGVDTSSVEALEERIGIPILPTTSLRRVSDTYRQEAAKSDEEASALRQTMESRDDIGGFIGAGAIDAFQNPSAMLSLVGGPAGAVAVADAYAAAYEQGLEMGLKGEQLETWASTQAAPEALAVVPAGKVLSKLPVIGPLIKKRVDDIATGLVARMTNPAIAAAARTARVATGESLEEMATGSMQDIAAAAFAGQQTYEGLQRAGQATMPQDEEGQFSISEFLANRGREARASIVTVGLGAPAIAGQAQAQFEQAKTQEEIDTTSAALAAEGRARQPRVQPAPAARPEPTQPSLFDTPEDTSVPITFEEQEAARRRALEEDAAYNVKRRQEAATVTRNQRRAELEESYRRRVDTAQGRVEELQDAIEGGDTSTATLRAATAAQQDLNRAQAALDRLQRSFQTPAQDQPVQPEEQAQTAREPEQVDFVEQQLQEQRARAANQVAARREAVRKRQEAEAKRQAAAQKSQTTKQRNAIIDRLIAENPDLSDAEIAELADRTPMEPTTPTPEQQESDLTKRVQGVINQLSGAQKRRTSIAQRRRITSLIRQNPDATAQEIAQQFREELLGTQTTAEAEEGSVPDEADIRAQYERLRTTGSLNMAAGPTVSVDNKKPEESKVPSWLPRERTPEQRAEYEGKVRQAVKSLSRANTNQTADVTNLIRQGKLILTDRPESIGRETTDAAAQYDIADGRMYVYLDRIDPQSAASVTIAALHEATHGGQFNNREGRPDIYTHMMGAEGVAAANGKIRRAANEGNKTAQKAVAAATAAAGTDANLENLELVPYFVSEAVKARGTSLGRLGGVVRDIRSSARNFARERLGRSLEFDLSDIDSAAQRVGQEIVETDLQGRGAGQPLDMIGGAGATDFQSAQRQGRTFTPAVDGLERFEFDDSQAELTTDPATVQALVDGETVPLNEFMQHAELERQYPDLYNRLKVKVDPKMTESSGAYLKGVITVPPSVLETYNTRPEELRNTILHEVQHAIQELEGFVPGTNKANFIPRDILEMEQFDKQRVDRLVKEFELGAGVNGLSPEAAQRWKNIVGKYGNTLSPEQQKLMFVEGGFHTQTSDRNVQRQGTRLLQAKSNLRSSRNVLREAEKRATKIYAADRGEAEARNVEARSRMTPEEREALPFESTIGEDVGLQAEQLLDTTPFVGRPERAPVQSTSLNMAGTTVPTPSPAPQAVPRARLSVREQVKRIVAHGRQERVADIKAAEDLETRFTRALKEDTGSRVLTPEVNQMVLDALSTNDMTALQAKLPNLAGVVSEARARITDGTIEVLDNIMGTGRPLSTEERKSVSTLMANLDTYLTRSYAAFQQGIGRKWAETRWANYRSNLGKALDSIKSDKVRQDVEAVRKGIDFLRKDLEIPSNDVLEDMTMDRLASMYERHGGKLNRLQYDRNDPDPQLAKREALINTLAQVRDSYTPAQLDQMAEDAAKSLMGLSETGSRYVKELAGLAKDPGTLKKREHIPVALRKMLGEIEASPGIILSTLSAQAALKARTQVMAELLREHDGTLVMSPEEFSRRGQFKGRDKWVPVEGTPWGQLDGYFVHPKVFSNLNEALSTFYTWRESWDKGLLPFLGKVAKEGIPATLGTANRYAKMSTVIGNPFNWVGNAIGSPLTLIGAGNFNFKAAQKGLSTALDYVRGTARSTSTDLLEEAIRYLNIEAADVGEIQNILGGKMQQYLDGTLDPREADSKIRAAIFVSAVSTGAGLGAIAAGPAGAAVGAAIGTTVGSRTVRNSVVATYAILDNWAKIANYHDRKDTLTRMYEAAGVKKSNEEIAREAGDDTSYTNLSPERVPDAIKAVERYGASQFAPYFYEVFRTRYSGYAQAWKDIGRGDELKAQGKTEAANIMYAAAYRRLLGHSIATVGMPLVGAIRFAPLLTALGLGAQYAMALSEDDEEKESKRRLLSEFNRDQDVIVMGYDENGFPYYLPISQRMDPNGPFTDILRAAVYADSPETFAKNLASYAYTDMYVAPRWVLDLYKSVTDSTAPESDITRIFPQIAEIGEKYGAGANAVNRVMNVFDSFLPGALRAQRTQFSAEGMVKGGLGPTKVASAINKFTGANVQPKQIADFLNLTGARFEKLDPVRVIKDYSSKSKEQAGEIAGRFNRDLVNSVDLTKEKVMDAAMRFRYDELKRQQEDYKNVKSLRDWGYPEDQIGPTLEEAGYSNEQDKYVDRLVAGEGTPIIKLKSLIGYIDSSSSFSDSREKNARREKGKAAVQMLLELEPELNKIGVVLDKKGMPKEYKQ